jgi:hypothetical protein
MTIKIHNAATDSNKTYTGSVDDIKKDLLEHFSFLKRYNAEDLGQMLYHINRQQYYFVSVE